MRRLSILAAVLLVALAVASAARADGDPASDFLYLGTLFPSFVDPPSKGPGDELRGVLAASKARGYPIKVALIETKQDLGQYPQLFGKPQRYADLLASELTIYKKLRAPVIVVTPNGLGIAGNERHGGTLGEVSHARAAALLRGLEAPSGTDGDDFAKVAIAAVRQVARAGGHPLPEKVAPVADAPRRLPPRRRRGSAAGCSPEPSRRSSSWPGSSSRSSRRCASAGQSRRQTSSRANDGARRAHGGALARAPRRPLAPRRPRPLGRGGRPARARDDPGRRLVRDDGRAPVRAPRHLGRAGRLAAPARPRRRDRRT